MKTRHFVGSLAGSPECGEMRCWPPQGKSLQRGHVQWCLTLLASKLTDATNKTNELVTAFRNGQIGAGEMTAKIAESIPVLDQIWNLGTAIGDMLGNQLIMGTPAWNNLKRGEKLHAELTNLRTMEKVNKTIENVSARNTTVLELTAMKDGPAKEYARIQDDFGQRLKDIEDRAKASKEANGGNIDAAVALQMEEEKIAASRVKEAEEAKLLPDQLELAKKAFKEVRSAFDLGSIEPGEMGTASRIGGFIRNGLNRAMAALSATPTTAVGGFGSDALGLGSRDNVGRTITLLEQIRDKIEGATFG